MTAFNSQQELFSLPPFPYQLWQPSSCLSNAYKGTYLQQTACSWLLTSTGRVVKNEWSSDDDISSTLMQWDTGIWNTQFTLFQLWWQHGNSAVQLIYQKRVILVSIVKWKIKCPFSSEIETTHCQHSRMAHVSITNFPSSPASLINIHKLNFNLGM